MTSQLALIECPTAPWRLDDTTRAIGRRGVAEARAALRAARQRAAGLEPTSLEPTSLQPAVAPAAVVGLNAVDGTGSGTASRPARDSGRQAAAAAARQLRAALHGADAA